MEGSRQVAWTFSEYFCAIHQLSVVEPESKSNSQKAIEPDLPDLLNGRYYLVRSPNLELKFKSRICGSSLENFQRNSFSLPLSPAISTN